ncbi:flagellin [Rhodospirillum centenum]|uniref:Flagellin n=1 Tax=Rhodospirillum centenum (strain ATCC 51521 / SW) TaxID=414684 RepID=B6IQB8_RHOCS|nr:flagellin [Rhodospirillum centenum]ACI97654.1 flagellin protein FlaB (LafA), putative [Rhodospirillum centenum SW]
MGASSILTNTGAMVALQTLNRTSKDLQTVQDRISTGMKVATAKDNSSYWGIATTMKADVSALKALNENISINAATVQTARVGTENIQNLLSQVKSQLALATTASVDHSKITAELTSLQNQITNTINAASYNGENLLNNTTARTLVVSINRSATGISAVTDSVSGVDLTAVATAVGGYVTAITGGADAAAKAAAANTALTDATTGVEAQITTVVNAASSFGNIGKRLELQADFTSKLIDSLNEGIGTLVDANLNEESARLQALQVQQQLGIQALSIANGAPQNILSLFR